jgi:putative zinc finger/helix-turn-helix YgiT family protein
MVTLKKEKKFCFSCMEEHEVQFVKIEEKSVFKSEEVIFEAEYEYCKNTDEFLENEEQIKRNDLSLKDAYREKVGLLTSVKIKAIREKYGISQKQFSEVLGWGAATIIRYENHQVQDRAHDDILKKIESDPEWFLEMLHRVKEEIDQNYFSKYYKNAIELLNQKINPYTISFSEINYNAENMNFDFDPLISSSHGHWNNTTNGENYGDFNGLISPNIVAAA